MFADQSCDFEVFDQLDPAVVDWRTLFNPLEGNLTIAILDLPAPGQEETLVHDIVMVSSDKELGKWNFGLEVQVGWDKQFNVAVNGDVFGGISSPVQTLPTPQSDNAEGSVVYHFMCETGIYTCHTGWICPWCECHHARDHHASFGSVDDLKMHLESVHRDLFSVRFEVLLFLVS
jgi:hypothetical protein